MFRKLCFTVAAAVCLTVLGSSAANATQSVTWTGNGLDSISICQRGVDRPFLHWVLTPGGKPVAGTTAELFIDGKDVGSMAPVGDSGALQVTIRVSKNVSVEMIEDATAYAVITSGSVGDNSVLTISDGCLCKYD
jgi:hypothetical protein